MNELTFQKYFQHLRPSENDGTTGWELRIEERCTFRSFQATLAWRLRSLDKRQPGALAGARWSGPSSIECLDKRQPGALAGPAGLDLHPSSVGISASLGPSSGPQVWTLFHTTEGVRVGQAPARDPRRVRWSGPCSS